MRWALPGLRRFCRWAPEAGPVPSPRSLRSRWPDVPGPVPAPTAPLVSRGGRPGPLRAGPPIGLGGLAGLSEPSALTGTGRSGRSERSGLSPRGGRSGRSVRLGLSDTGRSGRAAPSPSGERGAPLPLSSPWAGAPGRWDGRVVLRGPPWSSRRGLSEPRSPRSEPLRERLLASCVVTPAMTGAAMSSMRFGSEPSTVRGARPKPR